MEFTERQMEKASKAKSAEELINLAKEENITLTSDDAKKYFKMLNTKEGEVTEEELDNVAGGTCYSEGVYGPKGFQKYAITTAVNKCKGFYGPRHPLNGCSYCSHSFYCGPTLYCGIRTKENDPYR